MALNKKNRLKRKKDFGEVFKKGKAARGNYLFAKYLKNDLGSPRFAFVVSFKVSKKAVIRNRIRRILAEASRLKLKSVPAVDVVLIADKRIVGVSREKIIEDLSAVFKKVNKA